MANLDEAIKLDPSNERYKKAKQDSEKVIEDYKAKVAAGDCQ